jgi:AcrR family transcriptional regulator
MPLVGHRQDLLEGATKCLLEKGYARTTARDIVAASGTNLGSIGYHYGSTQALMNAAMIAAMEQWGETVGAALAATSSSGDAEADPLLRFWRTLIATVSTERALWFASIDAMVAAEHEPPLKAQLAEAIEQGRSGMAAMLTGAEESTLDPAVVRGLGSVQMALMSGVIIQWLTDPARAPSPEQVVAGLRALAAIS